MELVTAEALPGVVDKCIASGLYSCDLETTGLDVRVFEGRTKDQIVGVCLSPDGVHGYYAPVRHKGTAGAKHNISVSLFESELRRLVTSEAKPIFHKGKFDHEFLEFCGGEPIGVWDDPNGWEDSLILGYLSNNKLERVGLKFLTDQFFNPHVEDDRRRRKNGEKVPTYQIELWELFPDGKEGEHYDFSELDPGWEPVVWYASGDAIFTYRLFKRLYPLVVKPEEGVSQRTIYNIEKMCATATRWMERCRVHTNQDRVAELICLGQKELFDSIKAIYDFCEEACGRDIAPAWWHVLAKGVPYEGDKEDLPPLFNPDNAKQDYRMQIEEANKVVEHNLKRPTWDRSETLAQIVERRNTKVTKSLSDGKTYEFPYQCDVMSPRQLGPLFEEMEIPGLKRTEKSKQVMTSAAELDRLTEKYGESFPFMARIKRFREVQTALSRFLLPMRDDVCPEDSTLKIDFEAWRTDTGRFSTPSDKNPKRNGGTSYMMHATPATYDPKRPECLRRLRECITARPGRILAAIDYGGEEIRIITNLSREPKWIIEHFRCSDCGKTFDQGDGKNTPEAPPHFCPRCGSDKIGDIHTLSTIAFYGEDSQKNKQQFKQLRKNAKCVHPDTIVVGSHLARIGSLPVGEPDSFASLEDQVLWTGSVQGKLPGSFVNALESYNGGEQSLYHVVARRGVVTCSKNHRFLTADGRLVSIADGLKEGTILAESVAEGEDWQLEWSEHWTSLPYRTAPSIPVSFVPTNVHLAYFAGLFCGDGAKQGTTSVSLTHGPVGKADRLGIPYAEWQDELVAACVKVGFTPTRRKKTVYLGSRHCMRFLKALGLIKGGDTGRRALRIPDWVLMSGRKGLLSFLGGLFDTDGSAGKDGHLAVTTKDPIFAGQIAASLSALGILPYVEPCWNRTYKRWYFRVRIRASQALALKKYMRHRGKKARLRRATSHAPKDNAVLKVLPAGKGPCVDVHLDSSDHLYWTNGLVTHNSANFALCYGGAGSAVQRSTGVDENEGWRIYRQFTATYTQLQNWIKGQHEFVKQNGYVLTAFGRRCPLPDIHMPKKDPRTGRDNGFFISKAKRNAVNAPIQGSGADILKLAMSLIYKECKKRGWLEKVYMIACMHDEIVFEIQTDILEEALNVIMPLMIRNSAILKLRWPIPLVLDCEMGYDWTVPWNLIDYVEGKKEWPDEIKSFFPQALAASAGKAANEASSVNEANEVSTLSSVNAPTGYTKPLVEIQPEPTEAAPALVPSEGGQKPVAIPDFGKGDVYVHRLRKPLRQGTVENLAQVLYVCRNRGSHPIEIRSSDGEQVLWRSTDFTINPVQFAILADQKGI